MPAGETGSSGPAVSRQHPGTIYWPAGATAVWGLVVWGAAVVGASVPLAILGVAFWWLIPVLGAVVPFVFVALRNRTLGSREAGAVSADRE